MKIIRWFGYLTLIAGVGIGIGLLAGRSPKAPAPLPVAQAEEPVSVEEPVTASKAQSTNQSGAITLMVSAEASFDQSK